jgi:hypothetical protein
MWCCWVCCNCQVDESDGHKNPTTNNIDGMFLSNEFSVLASLASVLQLTLCFLVLFFRNNKGDEGFQY